MGTTRENYKTFNIWNQSKIFPVVRATLAIMIDKVPATHVASPKLPYPSLVAGAGRKHLPDGTPKPQTKWKTIREKSTNTPSISVSSNG